MLLLKRSIIKEFKSSREQINDETHEFNYSFIKATNPLENYTITVCKSNN